MMEIRLENLGRRYNQDWIFRKLNLDLHSKNSYAILGPNGAGKSTLLQIISGSLSPSEGKIEYLENGKKIDSDSIYRSIAIAAPYLELIEEFTLSELIDFHFSFKNFLPGINKDELIELLGLKAALLKPVKYFSSGMKQRTKLALAVCSDVELLLLDEPTSNLDNQGISWYRELLSRFSSEKLLIIGSNQEHEYQMCNNLIHIGDYKRKS